MTYQFTCSVDIGADAGLVFDLARDVDAHITSTAGSRERAIAGVTSGRLELGDEVTWQAWHLGLPWRMTSRIVELERPHRFVDRQVSGPFRAFRHEHTFEPRPWGTTMHDVVVFDAPLGPVGDVVERAVLGPYLRRLLTRRGLVLKQIAEEHD